MKYKYLNLFAMITFGLFTFFAVSCNKNKSSEKTPTQAPEALAITPTADIPTQTFRVMNWNIWHGGRKDGEDIGPQRVIDIIKEANPDILAMQETYQSGEIISEGLGYHLLARGEAPYDNISIHSKYPILEDISVFEYFKCAGALIELPDQTQIAFYSIWLPYTNGDIWEPEVRENTTVEYLLEACQPSADDLASIYAAIEERLADEAYADVPIVIAGDFNSMSHLDYTEDHIDQFHYVVNWATSHVLTDQGFTDAYRQANPTVQRYEDATWSPRFGREETEQERIDYIYYNTPEWTVDSCIVIDEHPAQEQFPSDHAALLSVFEWDIE